MVPPPSHDTVGVSKQITLLIFHFISSTVEPLLKLLVPLYKHLIFFIILLVSSSSILVFRYYFFLCLRSLQASRLTLFRVPTLFWFGSCNHCILICFLGFENREHSSSKHGLYFFSSYIHRLFS